MPHIEGGPYYVLDITSTVGIPSLLLDTLLKKKPAMENCHNLTLEVLEIPESGLAYGDTVFKSRIKDLIANGVIQQVNQEGEAMDLEQARPGDIFYAYIPNSPNGDEADGESVIHSGTYIGGGWVLVANGINQPHLERIEENVYFYQELADDMHGTGKYWTYAPGPYERKPYEKWLASQSNSPQTVYPFQELKIRWYRPNIN